jgi:hypothetical protein
MPAAEIVALALVAVVDSAAHADGRFDGGCAC